MTKKELYDYLEDVPDNAEIFIGTEEDGVDEVANILIESKPTIDVVNVLLYS